MMSRGTKAISTLPATGAALGVANLFAIIGCTGSVAFGSASSPPPAPTPASMSAPVPVAATAPAPAQTAWSPTEHGAIHAPADAKEFQGHRYAWTTRIGNWEQVESDAKRMGGELVSIDSAEESQWLLQTFGDGPYWIGLVQAPRSPEPREGWRWAGDIPISFTNWAPGQPDNYTGRDNFGFLVKGSRGFWGDVPVEGWPPTSNYRGVVEFSLR